MDWRKCTIKELEDLLFASSGTEIDEAMLEALDNDERSGVQKLLARYRTMVYEEKARRMRWEKMNEFSRKIYARGYRHIVGVDEAGRGPLAGPVVAAAVILDPEEPIYGLDDSKKLTEKKREELYEIIMDKALAVAVGIVSNEVIDQVNILQATFQAMNEAINKLSLTADYVLVDGNMEIPGLGIPQEAVIDGDLNVDAIAAASIIAKVTRDRILYKYHELYPEYGFDRNKGYGTSEHIEALKKYGPTPIHRYSYTIVNNYFFEKVKDNLIQAGNKEELRDIGQMIASYALFSEENQALLRQIYRKKYLEVSVNSEQ
ncbi:MAG: ribonuclease HII [Halanaerobiales bacterium]